MGIHLSLQVDKDLKIKLCRILNHLDILFFEYLILNFQIWLFIFYIKC